MSFYLLASEVLLLLRSLRIQLLSSIEIDHTRRVLGGIGLPQLLQLHPLIRLHLRLLTEALNESVQLLQVRTRALRLLRVLKLQGSALIGQGMPTSASIAMAVRASQKLVTCGSSLPLIRMFSGLMLPPRSGCLIGEPLESQSTMRYVAGSPG